MCLHLQRGSKHEAAGAEVLVYADDAAAREEDQAPRHSSAGLLLRVNAATVAGPPRRSCSGRPIKVKSFFAFLGSFSDEDLAADGSERAVDRLL
jgi:hypothetical protein